MRRRMLILLFAVLLAGCAKAPSGSGSVSTGDASVEEDVTGCVLPTMPEPPLLVDTPDSPYPLVVESWRADLDGDGTEELLELRAEKFYNYDGEFYWVEQNDPDLRPYSLSVTHGETAAVFPLAPKDTLYFACYWNNAPNGQFWTQDSTGLPVLVLWFDNMTQGGAGGIDVYAVGIRGGKPDLLPFPIYSIRSVPDEESMTAQVTAVETGYTETLDITQYPSAPVGIDRPYCVEQTPEGILLRQYIFGGGGHGDGMGDLVTALTWKNGWPVILEQHFQWY